MAFDFDAAVTAPFRMQPGLRRLDPGQPQLTPLAAGSRQQREKLAVLSAFAAQALVARPGFDAQPALQVLFRQAASEHPAHFQLHADGSIAALGVRVREGQVLQVSAGVFGLGDEVARCVALQDGPWRAAALFALAFAEDLAIVDARDTSVPWMSVALPSHWAPEVKVGLPFAQIHQPVADAERVRQAGEALMRLVSGAVRWERFVWNVTDSPRLHTHPARVSVPRWGHDPDALAAGRLPRAWFRSERQTFVPVPELLQSVFTIGVEVQPLDAVVSTPERAHRLAEAVATMSPEVLSYRGLTPVREALLHWLRQRAMPAPA